MINDCISQSIFGVLEANNPEYRKLSKRFHFALCKMLDGGLRRGTSSLVGDRVLRGWEPCHEKLFPSDRNLSEREYADWTKISRKAWIDSKERTINKGRSFLKYFAFHPNEVIDKKELIIDKDKYILLAQSSFGSCDLFLGPKPIWINIYNKNDLIIGWATIYVKHALSDQTNIIQMGDFYIKDHYRNKGMGSGMIEIIVDLINSLFKSHRYYGRFKWELGMWIPAIDINSISKKRIVSNFLKKNRFKVYFIKDKKEDNPDYSKLLAIGEI